MFFGRGAAVRVFFLGTVVGLRAATFAEIAFVRGGEPVDQGSAAPLHPSPWDLQSPKPPRKPLSVAESTSLLWRRVNARQGFVMVDCHVAAHRAFAPGMGGSWSEARLKNGLIPTSCGRAARDEAIREAPRARGEGPGR